MWAGSSRSNSYLLLLVLLIGACASPPETESQPTVAEARRTEQSVSTSLIRQQPVLALQELDRALQLYSLADQLDGQLRVHLKLARLYLRMGQQEMAQQHLQAASQVAAHGADPRQRYALQLLKGRMVAGQAAFAAALSVARTPVERAVALTYLERYQEAYALAGSLDAKDIERADDLAFVCYRYARHAGDEQAGLKALQAYRLADNHQGITDSLFLLGRLYQQQGQPDIAARYMNRALQVSRAMGDDYRTRAIEKALADL